MIVVCSLLLTVVDEKLVNVVVVVVVEKNNGNVVAVVVVEVNNENVVVAVDRVRKNGLGSISIETSFRDNLPSPGEDCLVLFTMAACVYRNASRHATH